MVGLQRVTLPGHQPDARASHSVAESVEKKISALDNTDADAIGMASKRKVRAIARGGDVA
jgi:hypothetical protein